MDPPLVNESSFSPANPASYTLAEIWPFHLQGGASSGGGLGLRMSNFGFSVGDRDGSAEESTVTDQSAGAGRKRRDFSSEEDESSRIVSTTSSANELVSFFSSIPLSSSPSFLLWE
ncbi:Transcription factor bHLH79 [Linum grandiflorum]